MYVNEIPSSVMLHALGQRIRELRTEQGYSQEAFADRCGVHRTFMGTVERGESNLSFQNIAKVATTLGITLSVLFVDLEAKAKVLTAQSTAPVPAKAQNQAGAKPRLSNGRE